MVKFLSENDNTNIEASIEKAERGTSAEIVLVIARSNDSYLDFILPYGILATALIDAVLYKAGLFRNFFSLEAIQITLLSLLFFIPFLRKLGLRFVPSHILHQRTARRALEEYHIVHRRLPATAPIALMFLSLNERHTHIISSHAVYEKIPDETWQIVIDDFTKAVASNGLGQCCMNAVESIGSILAKHFPKKGEASIFSNQIIEKE